MTARYASLAFLAVSRAMRAAKSAAAVRQGALPWKRVLRPVFLADRDATRMDPSVSDAQAARWRTSRQDSLEPLDWLIVFVQNALTTIPFTKLALLAPSWPR